MASVSLKNVSKTYGSSIHAVQETSLEVHDNEFLVLVGPSGCGKTTILRLISGLEEASSGEIFIDSKRVDAISPKDRDIAMIFQNYALYPHMNVFENMAFGLKLRKIPPSEIKHRVEEVSQLLGIQDFLNRKPRELSGGQRQRVAMGRAIVREPKVFLMDEPLSNLDAQLRVQMRAELQKLHHRLRITTIYVTHDQTEAMTLGSRIVVMKDGMVQQINTPMALYDQPANLFVAGFIGNPAINFVEAGVASGPTGMSVNLNNASLKIPKEKEDSLRNYIGKKIVIGIRPEDLHLSEATCSSEFKLTVIPEVVELLGSEAYLHFQVNSRNWIAKVPPHAKVSVGTKTELTIDMQRMHAFNPQSGISIYLGTLPEVSPQKGECPD